MNTGLPQELKGFNWGALFFTFIWGHVHKWHLPYIIIPLLIIPSIGPMVAFIFAIYFGIKGNEIAWNNTEWRDVNHFKKVQHKWAIWGWIILALIMAVGAWFVNSNIDELNTLIELYDINL